MKPFAVLLLAVSFLISSELKTGYYLTLKDFLNNTPTPATIPTRVSEGRGEFGTEASAYFVEEQENNEYKKVRGELFAGYCDSGKVYLVDNPNPFKGRIMRSVVIGRNFSYYHGVDFQMNSGGGSTGGASFSTPAGKMSTGGSMNGGGSTPVPVLVVINMKTGEQTSVANSIFQKPTVKALFAEYPELFEKYKANKIRTLSAIESYLIQANEQTN